MLTSSSNPRVPRSRPPDLGPRVQIGPPKWVQIGVSRTGPGRPANLRSNGDGRSSMYHNMCCFGPLGPQPLIPVLNMDPIQPIGGLDPQKGVQNGSKMGRFWGPDPQILDLGGDIRMLPISSNPRSRDPDPQIWVPGVQIGPPKWVQIGCQDHYNGDDVRLSHPEGGV